MIIIIIHDNRNQFHWCIHPNIFFSNQDVTLSVTIHSLWTWTLFLYRKLGWWCQDDWSRITRPCWCVFNQISRLNREHEGEVSDLQSRIQHLSSDLDHTKGELTSHLTDLMEELRTVKKEARDREESLQQEIRWSWLGSLKHVGQVSLGFSRAPEPHCLVLNIYWGDMSLYVVHAFQE